MVDKPLCSHCAWQRQTPQWLNTAVMSSEACRWQENALSHCAPFLVTGFSEYRQPFRSQSKCFPGSTEGDI